MFKKLNWEVVKLFSKLMWLLSGILILVFAPLKIASAFYPMDFVESGYFVGLFLVILVAMYVISKVTNINIQNLEVKRNIPLGILSLIISVCFYFCISSFYNDTTLYDFEWQPVLMALLSIFSIVSFLIMAFVHFSGKNVFPQLAFFLFCPVFWFALDMILFLSIQNDNSDVYDIALTAFLALFFLYYTQVYSTSSERNIVKLTIFYGLPAFALMLIKCVPVMINCLNHSAELSNAQVSTCAMEAAVSFYALVVVIEAFKQISESSFAENK